MKFVDPRNDVAFKKIFGSEQHTEILISFLNAVMGLSGEREIKHLTILNPYQTPTLQSQKCTLLDIRATDHRDHTFIVEVNLEYGEGFARRFLYHGLKASTEQIGIGPGCSPRLLPVYLIGVLDFCAFKSEDYRSHHRLTNTETGKHEIPGMEFYFVELPKFTKQEHELTSVLDKWLFFIKHASDLEVVPASADTAPLQTAYQMANHFGWSQEDLEIYESRSIKIQDERGTLQAAIDRGRTEGERRKAEQTARALLTEGLPTDVVVRCTGLSAEEVAALQESASS